MANHAMQASNCLTGAEAMLRMLDLHGVRHVFGLCGDTSLPFYDAFARMEHPIRHHLLRDERHAAYAADAYARLTGLAGVTEGPSGGGATHILPGVAEANESSVPLLAITTDVATASSGRYPLTELDQEALFGAVSRRSRPIRSADWTSILTSCREECVKELLSPWHWHANPGCSLPTNRRRHSM